MQLFYSILLWCSMSLGGGKSTIFNNAVNAAVDSVSRNTVTCTSLLSAHPSLSILLH